MSHSTQTIVIGNSIDINIDPGSCNSEIRADVIVSEFTSVRLWGQILNCDGEPVSNALVKLVKITGDSFNKSYEGISHTKSDCEGFYQFDICSDENGWYKILVGKSNTGKEIIVSSTNKTCPSCSSEIFPPHSSLEENQSNSPYPHTDSEYNSDSFYDSHQTSGFYEDSCSTYSPDIFMQESPSYTTNASPFNFSTPKDHRSK